MSASSRFIFLWFAVIICIGSVPPAPGADLSTPAMTTVNKPMSLTSSMIPYFYRDNMPNTMTQAMHQRALQGLTLQQPAGVPPGLVGAGLIELPIVFIKVSNDDGSEDAGEAFSDDTIRALIDDTNAIYVPDVKMKPVLQGIYKLRNSLINHLTDWDVPECPDAHQTILNPIAQTPLAKLFPEWFRLYLSPSQFAAYNYAKNNFPHSIVVLYSQEDVGAVLPRRTDCAQQVRQGELESTLPGA